MHVARKEIVKGLVAVVRAVAILDGVDREPHEERGEA